MEPSEPVPRKRLQRLDWLLIAATAFLLLILALPHLPPISFGNRPIADLYNPVSKDLTGILMKIDPEHRFPNGQTCEGWLVRGVNGLDIWFPAENMKNVDRVNR